MWILKRERAAGALLNEQTSSRMVLHRTVKMDKIPALMRKMLGQMAPEPIVAKQKAEWRVRP